MITEALYTLNAMDRLQGAASPSECRNGAVQEKMLSRLQLGGPALEDQLMGPYSRYLGNTEQNWCRAVDGGTGNTVIGLLFKANIDGGVLQRAVDAIQERHPRIRSRITNINGKLAFQTAPHPYAKVEVIESWTAPESDDETSPLPEASESKDNDKDSLVANETAGTVDCVDASNASANDIEKGNGPEFEECRVQQSGSGVEQAYKLSIERQGAGSKEEERKARRDSWDREGNLKYLLNMCDDKWLKVVEWEMNMPLREPSEESLEPSQAPLDLLKVRLYRMPHGRSLVILRAHTCACDRVSAGAVTGDLLAALDLEVNDGEGSVDDAPGGVSSAEENDKVAEEASKKEFDQIKYPTVEEAIPKGQANKPFWAHGVDVIGYGLSSRRHACLKFEKPEAPRRSALIRSGLSKADTDALLAVCEKERTNLYGALSAALLKAAAASKQLGSRQEAMAITTLLDCRPLLAPPLPSDAVGFYHSALLNTHQVSEHAPFWDLARRCSGALDNALKHRKHFTDMGDLNMLMTQAMQHPHLTPAASLRTSMLVAFRDILFERMQAYSEKLGIEDYVGCSSIHGVGPCLAIFDSVREDGLHLANVYVAPLHSRAQMKAVVADMMLILHQAIPNNDSGASKASQ
eukprot:jgi/Mesen1/10191/ME000076S09695